MKDQSVTGVSRSEGSISDWDLLLLRISQCQGSFEVKDQSMSGVYSVEGSVGVWYLAVSQEGSPPACLLPH